MWRWKIKTKQRKRASSVTKHYTEHKEQARVLVQDRLAYWNQFYNFSYKRVAIRNQKTCWGSCSSLGNLNFSYRLLFLPPHIADYIIVHELCHLGELNHSRAFWCLVEQTIPDHVLIRKELRHIEQAGVKALLDGYKQRKMKLDCNEGEIAQHT